MNGNDHRIKITFGDRGSAPELEVNTPLHSNAGTRVWAVLASLRINPSSAYLVRSECRLITRVKLTERNGMPLSQHRAVKLMRALKDRLLSAGADHSIAPRSGELVHCACTSSESEARDRASLS
jgi:hypothetical protein